MRVVQQVIASVQVLIDASDCVQRPFTLFRDRMECELSGNEMLVIAS